MERDIEHVACYVRKADYDELWAAYHQVPYEAIWYGVLASRVTQVGTAYDVPFCIFGVSQRTPFCDIGIPWMVSTYEIEQHWRRFLRGSIGVVEGWARDFPYMENWVDERNRLAVEWLSWLGFVIHAPEPFGLDRLPFHRFTMGE